MCQTSILLFEWERLSGNLIIGSVIFHLRVTSFVNCVARQLDQGLEKNINFHACKVVSLVITYLIHSPVLNQHARALLIDVLVSECVEN